MTGKGILVRCIEDMEIDTTGESDFKSDITFIKDILYTALIGEEIYVIDRNHKNQKLTISFFEKHFKILTNG